MSSVLGETRVAWPAVALEAIWFWRIPEGVALELASLELAMVMIWVVRSLKLAEPEASMEATS